MCDKKKIAVLALIVLIVYFEMPGQAQSDNETGNSHDEQLAAKLGADEYGMRSYIFVVLKTGPAEIEDEERRRELFAGHFSNMARLSEQGKLVVAGPFIDGGDKRGMYIFDAASVEEARELVQTDPAVAAGIFTAEYTRFYGSAALIMIRDLHAKIQKTEIG